MHQLLKLDKKMELALRYNVLRLKNEIEQKRSWHGLWGEMGETKLKVLPVFGTVCATPKSCLANLISVKFQIVQLLLPLLLKVQGRMVMLNLERIAKKM